MNSLSLRVFGSAIALCLIAGSAQAQYDRDGRYVPQANGVPLDPTRPAIPLSSGTPGVPARGEPQRIPDSPQRLPNALSPRASDTFPPPRHDPRTVGITRRACAEGWSRKSGLPKRIFEARCKRFEGEPGW
jgi:hypothetical protein